MEFERFGDGRKPYTVVVGDEFFTYAAKPDHIPKEWYDRFFGFLNKEHATTKYDRIDILNLIEDIEILKIRTMHSHTEDELSELDEEGWMQVFNLCYALAKKSEDGFLIQQYRTQHARVEQHPMRIEEKKGLFGRFRRSEQQSEVMQQ